MDDDDTQQLVEQAREGDSAATALLMQKHRPRLKRMVGARMDPRMQGRVDPSDVIQETLTTAFQQLPGYLEEQPIPFYPWLRRIAWQKLAHLHQRHLDAARRNVRREERQDCWISDQSAVQLAQLVTSRSASPSAGAQCQEAYQQVRGALEQLDSQDREVILQRYLEQLSIQEISATLDATEATIRMRHLRALQKLQRLLHSEDQS
jgi:RNA polymerase sigma-70 factor (ECF subfamily)